MSSENQSVENPETPAESSFTTAYEQAKKQEAERLSAEEAAKNAPTADQPVGLEQLSELPAVDEDGLSLPETLSEEIDSAPHASEPEQRVAIPGSGEIIDENAARAVIVTADKPGKTEDSRPQSTSAEPPIAADLNFATSAQPDESSPAKTGGSATSVLPVTPWDTGDLDEQVKGMLPEDSSEKPTAEIPLYVDSENPLEQIVASNDADNDAGTDAYTIPATAQLPATANPDDPEPTPAETATIAPEASETSEDLSGKPHSAAVPTSGLTRLIYTLAGIEIIALIATVLAREWASFSSPNFSVVYNLTWIGVTALLLLTGITLLIPLRFLIHAGFLAATISSYYYALSVKQYGNIAISLAVVLGLFALLLLIGVISDGARDAAGRSRLGVSLPAGPTVLLILTGLYAVSQYLLKSRLSWEVGVVAAGFILLFLIELMAVNGGTVGKSLASFGVLLLGPAVVFGLTFINHRDVNTLLNHVNLHTTICVGLLMVGSWVSVLSVRSRVPEHSE